MSKKIVRLTEGDLHKIIKESVNKLIKEGSYAANGNFDEVSHNNGLRIDLKGACNEISQSINSSLRTLSYIQNATTDERISKRTRVIINALNMASREMADVIKLINSDRWDID